MTTLKVTRKIVKRRLFAKWVQDLDPKMDSMATGDHLPTPSPNRTRRQDARRFKSGRTFVNNSKDPTSFSLIKNDHWPDSPKSNFYQTAVVHESNDEVS